MFTSKHREELVDEMYNNDELFDEFVEEWIEKHPEDVFYIVADWLADSKRGQEDYFDWVVERVDSDYEDYLERKADEAREEAMMRAMEEKYNV